MVEFIRELGSQEERIIVKHDQEEASSAFLEDVSNNLISALSLSLTSRQCFFCREGHEHAYELIHVKPVTFRR